MNSYYDFLNGVDQRATSEDRTLVDSILKPSDVMTMGCVAYLLSLVGFALSSALSSTPIPLLAILFFGGLSGSFLYTGGFGFKYLALGEVVVALCFGPLTVLYAFLAQCSPTLSSPELLRHTLLPVLYSLPLVLSLEAIIFTNNVRDREAHARAGAVTLAMLLSDGAVYVLFCTLLFAPFVIVSQLALRLSVYFVLPLLGIIYAFRIERRFRARQLAGLTSATARLNLLFGASYLLALALAL